MSKRIERVNSLLERQVAGIIAKEFHFPGTLITVTHADCSANLIEAKIYISVLPEEKFDMVLKALRAGIATIQQQINQALNMRPIPKIIFLRDEHIQEAARVEELLQKLKKEGK